MTEFLLRHALGRAVDQETLRRGLKSRTLEGRELEEFARVAVESGHAAIRWLEKTRRNFEENPHREPASWSHGICSRGGTKCCGSSWK